MRANRVMPRTELATKINILIRITILMMKLTCYDCYGYHG